MSGSANDQQLVIRPNELSPLDRARPIPEHIGEFISYDPVEGSFVRIKSSKKCFVGTNAAYARGVATQYLSVSFEAQHYPAHRVAWFLYYGEQPTALVDHKNGNSFDNRISNLRLATSRENSQNRRAPRKASSLPKGVSLKPYNRYQTSINLHGKWTYIGCFDTAEEASQAYQAAVRIHFKQFGRLD